MKLQVGMTLALAGALLAGCAAPKKTAAAPPRPTAPPPIITADNSLPAKVVEYNAVGRFVVLNFSGARLPKHGQVFSIYHDGLKSGEARITGPEQEDNVVADLLSGTAEAGDEVREQ
jgi:hypothetical protein